MGRALLALAFFAAAAAPDVSAADPVVRTVEEQQNSPELQRTPTGFVNPASGYVFPYRLGPMPARKTAIYAIDDVSVYYTLNGGGNGDAWLTVYAYPAKRPLSAEVADIEGALLQKMPGTPTSPPGFAALPEGALENWFDAAIEGTPVLTGYRILQSGDWFIETRMTIPRSGGEEAIEHARQALAEVAWTTPGR